MRAARASFGATAAGDPKLPGVPAGRVIDPACAATINLTTAPRATYQGKVYGFCRSADRHEFLKDPVAYLRSEADNACATVA
jgi:YHS domain-containing protein